MHFSGASESSPPPPTKRPRPFALSPHRCPTGYRPDILDDGRHRRVRVDKPFHGPALKGGVSLLARYGFRLTGPWRRVYAVCAGLALYVNVFVPVVQAFEKVSFLNAMAPTQTDPVFVVAQVVVLALLAALTIGAVRRFREAPLRLA